jgi:hypothetical protein
VGYGGRTTNVLRLYLARSSHEFDVQIFNQGDYLKAVELKIGTEIISKSNNEANEDDLFGVHFAPMAIRRRLIYLIGNLPGYGNFPYPGAARLEP